MNRIALLKQRASKVADKPVADSSPVLRQPRSHYVPPIARVRVAGNCPHSHYTLPSECSSCLRPRIERVVPVAPAVSSIAMPEPKPENGPCQRWLDRNRKKGRMSSSTDRLRAIVAPDLLQCDAAKHAGVSDGAVKAARVAGRLIGRQIAVPGKSPRWAYSVADIDAAFGRAARRGPLTGTFQLYDRGGGASIERE